MRTFQRIARLIRPAIGLPVLSALALGGLVLLAMGCGPNDRDAASSAPALAPRVHDVPVPAGFNFDAGESRDRRTAGFRSVYHLYKGSSGVRQVTEFYRRAMPANGWEPVDEAFQYGRQRLLFEKGGERCYVSVWDDWGTKLLIQVYPGGTGTGPSGAGTTP